MSKGYPDKDWHQPKYVTKPQTVTINSLFPHFDRWAIGFDPLLSAFKEVSSAAKQASYPPYNIRQINKDHYIIEMALAGFEKEGLSITLQENILSVSGEGINSFLPNSEFDYIHQGIARRDFEQEFSLAEHMEVKSAEFESGLLTITLERVLPEEKQPKQIPIK
jgi:molecular chaperone IbpA